jgi:uncharacterized protein CbrC (UPF0167 family)
MAVINRFVLEEVTPYGVARTAGYTGTKQEYAALLAGLATDAANAATSAADAADSADDAQSFAADATAAATEAQGYNSLAYQYAQQATASATDAQMAAIAANHGLDPNADRWLSRFAQKVADLVLTQMPRVEGGQY